MQSLTVNQQVPDTSESARFQVVRDSLTNDGLPIVSYIDSEGERRTFTARADKRFIPDNDSAAPEFPLEHPIHSFKNAEGFPVKGYATYNTDIPYDPLFRYRDAISALEDKGADSGALHIVKLKRDGQSESVVIGGIQNIVTEGEDRKITFVSASGRTFPRYESEILEVSRAGSRKCLYDAGSQHAEFRAHGVFGDKDSVQVITLSSEIAQYIGRYQEIDVGFKDKIGADASQRLTFLGVRSLSVPDGERSQEMLFGLNEERRLVAIPCHDIHYVKGVTNDESGSMKVRRSSSTSNFESQETLTVYPIGEPVFVKMAKALPIDMAQLSLGSREFSKS
jgi:hypothetical protein